MDEKSDNLSCNTASIRMLCLKLTHRCNLNCYMCGQSKLANSKSRQEIDINIIKQLLETIGTPTYGVYLWGGEPLVYSKFAELIEYFIEHNVYYTINTNGTQLDKYADILMSNKGQSRIIVSIDGLEDVHDKIRGAKGIYNRICSSLDYFARHKNKMLRISSNTVITTDNFNSLKEIADGLAKLPLDYMEFQLPMFFSKECGIQYEKIMKDEFSTKAESWRGFRGDYADVDPDVLVNVLGKIREKHGRKFRLVPNLIDREIILYFSEPNRIKDMGCSLPHSQLSVEPNGDVIVCPDFPDYVVGNLMDSSPDEIWNNNKLNTFRRYCETQKLPICSRCCNLHQF